MLNGQYNLYVGIELQQVGILVIQNDLPFCFRLWFLI